MSGAPVSFDRIIPEETQGPMPVEAPTTLASGSLDSFQHVEAVLKEDNVSTGNLDSQDWEMVTEMVEDTDNAATHFLQGKHVIDLDGPAPNLQDSIDTMMATMEKMRLGSTADGVEAPSRPEGVASAAAVPSVDAAPMDDMVVEQTTHKWKVFGRGTSSPTFILAEVPFSMEAVTKDIKLMVDKLSTEEIFDLFVKFCDSESIPAVSFGRVVKAYVAMKAQKVHDEVMKQPHVAGRSRPGVGSDNLRENTQPEPIATHQCPECFTDWATQWDPTKEKMCVCGKKVLPIKKTKHLVNMDHPTGNWLLFMTGNGITWVRDGKSEADAGGMRWILGCWQKPHCAQLTMPRPACRTLCRARTGSNFALKYSTEWLMPRLFHLKLRPGLRALRTVRKNRLLWSFTRMLQQPWPWQAS